MRRYRWTGLAALVVLAVALGAVGAGASPGASRLGATLRFQLTTNGAVAQPFDRWIGELAGMAALMIDSETWKGGEAMRVRVAMGEEEAWTVSLLAEASGVSMESSLMAPGSVILGETDALEARALMEGLRGVATGPDTLTLSAAQFADLAEGAARTLRRWGEAAKGTDGETAGAVGGFLEALAGIGEKADDEGWLTVTAEPREAEPMTVAPGGSKAPPELPGILAVEGFWAVMRAVTAG